MRGASSTDSPGTSNGTRADGEGSGAGREGAAGIATALAEISDRATLLIHEEIELAKAEVTQKVTKLARGAIVSAVAGVFVVTAVLFALIGCAWLIYFYLPVNQFAFFWGFFAMAVILLLLGAIAGAIAARVFKSSSAPVPNMAIEEARKIRDTVSGEPDAPAAAPTGATSGPSRSSSPPEAFHAPVSSARPPVPPVVPAQAPPPPAPAPAEPPPPAPEADVPLAADPPADAAPVTPESPPPPAGVSEPPAPADASDATTDELGPPVQGAPEPEDEQGGQ